MENAVQKYYYPQLDAIRGLSFIAVFFFHAYHPIFGEKTINQFLQFLYTNLELSIDVFFILSSFLLTWLGITEFEKKGNFSFKNYFIRRALRIWPLYYILMFFSFCIVPLFANKFGTHITIPPPSYYLFFIANYYTKDHVYFLKFLWTLSVEEQFYLLWGVCLLLFQKYLKVVIIIFLAVSILFTVYSTVKNIPVYFNTLTYLFDFSLGACIAVMIKRQSKISQKFQNFTKQKSALFLLLLPTIFLVFFFLQFNTTGITNNFINVCCRWVFIIYISLLIMEQMVNKQTLLKLGNNKFLIYTGKISYGLYCFHGIILTFGALLLVKLNLHIHPLLKAILLLTINYAVSSISYQYLETPFLKLKNQLRRL
jgi:peptidoglycan/LPS O-acetylase OafA/YrhL